MMARGMYTSMHSTDSHTHDCMVRDLLFVIYICAFSYTTASLNLNSQKIKHKKQDILFNFIIKNISAIFNNMKKQNKMYLLK